MTHLLSLIFDINKVIEFLSYELKYSKKFCSNGFPSSYTNEDITKFNNEIEDIEKAIYHLRNIVVSLHGSVDDYINTNV